MATINVRGYKIRVQAKPGTQLEFVKRMYMGYSDEQLARLAVDSIEHEKLAIEGRVWDERPTQ